MATFVENKIKEKSNDLEKVLICKACGNKSDFKKYKIEIIKLSSDGSEYKYGNSKNEKIVCAECCTNITTMHVLKEENSDDNTDDNTDDNDDDSKKSEQLLLSEKNITHTNKEKDEIYIYSSICNFCYGNLDTDCISIIGKDENNEDIYINFCSVGCIECFESNVMLD